MCESVWFNGKLSAYPPFFPPMTCMMLHLQYIRWKLPTETFGSSTIKIGYFWSVIQTAHCFHCHQFCSHMLTVTRIYTDLTDSISTSDWRRVSFNLTVSFVSIPSKMKRHWAPTASDITSGLDGYALFAAGLENLAHWDTLSIIGIHTIRPLGLKLTGN